MRDSIRSEMRDRCEGFTTSRASFRDERRVGFMCGELPGEVWVGTSAPARLGSFSSGAKLTGPGDRSPLDPSALAGAAAVASGFA